MKNSITSSIKLLVVFLGAALMLTSCEYQKIADDTYPPQLIYMPAAVYGNFVINTVALPIGSVPTPGNTYRYLVDTLARQFIVPLGVYRSGINNDGAFTVDIAVNTDTITKLQAVAGKLPAGTLLLPSTEYSIESSVEMKDGQEIASFDLKINLDLLVTNYPGKNYAIGVSVSSDSRPTNPKFATTIIVIGTDMMKPTASFNSAVTANVKVWNFTSTSLMTVGYRWNYGDGSAVDTIKAPVHTYAASGTYTVTLTALGITRYQDKSLATKTITVN
jgi:hypothetical protein